MEGTGYSVRRSLHNPKNIRLAKKAIRTAFEVQRRGLGFRYRRTPLHLFDKLGFVKPRSAPVRGRAHDPCLPNRRL